MDMELFHTGCLKTVLDIQWPQYVIESSDYIKNIDLKMIFYVDLTGVPTLF